MTNKNYHTNQYQYILLQVLAEGLDVEGTESALYSTYDIAHLVRKELRENYGEPNYDAFKLLYDNDSSSPEPDFTFLFSRDITQYQPLIREDITTVLEGVKQQKQGCEQLKYQFVIFEGLPFHKVDQGCVTDFGPSREGYSQDRN